MPLFLEFKPTKKISSDEASDELTTAILKISSLAHQGANASITRDNEGFIFDIKLVIKGISVVDNESGHMLYSIVNERIYDCGLPFFISKSTVTTHVLPGEAVFNHERFRPLRSKNSRLFAKFPDLEIPEEFCCKLSGDIMDDPVYDIRSPGVCYDQDFLQYWLRKSAQQLMPHTKMPCHDSFIKQNFDLKIRIVKFVKEAIASAEQTMRERLLQKFKLSATSDKKTLNQALRRASMAGEGDDINFLLSLGADVNAQDENPQKKNTALHWAIRENKISNAIQLVCSGARIDIPDATGTTACVLILRRLSDNDPEIQPLVLNCHLFGLVLPGVTSFRRQENTQTTTPHGQNGMLLFARSTQSTTQQPEPPSGFNNNFW